MDYTTIFNKYKNNDIQTAIENINKFLKQQNNFLFITKSLIFVLYSFLMGCILFNIPIDLGTKILTSIGGILLFGNFINSLKLTTYLEKNKHLKKWFRFSQKYQQTEDHMTAAFSVLNQLVVDQLYQAQLLNNLKLLINYSKNTYALSIGYTQNLESNFQELSTAFANKNYKMALEVILTFSPFWTSIEQKMIENQHVENYTKSIGVTITENEEETNSTHYKSLL